MTDHPRTCANKDVTTRHVRNYVKLADAPAHVREAAKAYLALAQVKGALVGAGRKVRR